MPVKTQTRHSLLAYENSKVEKGKLKKLTQAEVKMRDLILAANPVSFIEGQGDIYVRIWKKDDTPKFRAAWKHFETTRDIEIRYWSVAKKTTTTKKKAWFK
jgi:hypothetical protein